MNLNICDFTSENAAPATEFARCHHFTQPWQCDSEKNNATRLKCCACHAKWRWRSPKCCACHTKRLSTRYETCWTVTGLSRSATPATRNEATRLLKPPKSTTFAELAIGTAIRASREWLWRVANGCLANAASTPRPQEWNGNPCYAFGNKANKEVHPPFKCRNSRQHITHINQQILLRNKTTTDTLICARNIEKLAYG